MPDDSPTPFSDDPLSLRHHVLGAISLIEDALSHGGSGAFCRGAQPGLSDLTSGGYGGELRVVVGPSGCGKTTLAASIVSRLIEEGDKDQPLAWFSLQESGAHAALRLLCLSARLPLARVAAGDAASRSDLHSLSKVAQALSQYRVLVDDSSPLSVPALRARCEGWVRRKGLELILIDPVEALLDQEGERWGSSLEASENIADKLRLLARQLGTVVVAFASAPAEADAAPLVPGLDALPESLAPLVAEADMVLWMSTGLLRPGDGVVASALHVLKQSDSSGAAVIPLVFRPGLMLFEDVR